MFAFPSSDLTPPFIRVPSPLPSPLNLTVKGFHYHFGHKFTAAQRGTVLALAVIATGCYFGPAYARNFDRCSFTLDDLAWRNDLVNRRCEEGLALGLVRFDLREGYVFTDDALRILKKYA